MLPNEKYRELIKNIIKEIPVGEERTDEIIKNLNSRLTTDKSITEAFKDPKLNLLGKQIYYAFAVLEGDIDNKWKDKITNLLMEADNFSQDIKVKVEFELDYEKMGDVIKRAFIEALQDVNTYGVPQVSKPKKGSKKR